MCVVVIIKLDILKKFLILKKLRVIVLICEDVFWFLEENVYYFVC